MNQELYLACMKKGLNAKHVCEVGVYYPKTSNVLGFIKDGVRATLVEADPLCVEAMREFFSPYPNVEIRPVAVWERRGPVTLYRTNASTFVGELDASPALVNDRYQPKDSDRFTVDGVLFADLDSGDIDVLSIDIEGAEWVVIQTMKSRPKVVSLELQAGLYRNPNTERIETWFRENDYDLWFLSGSDAVYFRRDAIELSAPERAGLAFRNSLIRARREIRRFRKGLKAKRRPKN